MILSNICRKSSTTIVRKSSATLGLQSIAGLTTSAENHELSNNDFNPACFGVYNEMNNASAEVQYSPNAFTDFYSKQESATKINENIVKNIPNITSFAIHSAPIQNRLYRLIPDVNGQMIESPSGEELAQNYLNSSICGSESSQSNFDKSSSLFSQSISSTTTSLLCDEVLTKLSSQNNFLTQSSKNSNEQTPLTYETTSTIPSLAFSINAMPVNEIPSFAVPIAPSTDYNYFNHIFGISEFAEMIRESDGGLSQFEEMEQIEQSKLNAIESAQLNKIKNKSKPKNNILLKLFGPFLFKPSFKISV